MLRRERNPGLLPSTVFALEPRMPKQQLSLRMIKDLLRLKWHANLSHEQVAAALKISSSCWPVTASQASKI